MAFLVVISLLAGFAVGLGGEYGATHGNAADAGASPAVSAGPAPEVTPFQNIVRSPSDVPPEITRNVSSVVNVYLKAMEVTGQIESGTSYTYWTYNGTVPGPFLRVRVNDTVVVHFTNSATDKMTHSVDFHAVIGPGGGMAVDTAAPGESVNFSFRATWPGLFVYHCGTPDASMHIANGMFGLILVQPAVPLPPVNEEFYVMQSELYTQWPVHTAGNQVFDMSKLLNQTPSSFVFNGAYRALTGANQLHAVVNDTVRIYFGDAGPNFISSFHVIGEIMERVWPYGDLSDPPLHGVQTVVVPPGDSAVVDLAALYPGNYNLVDHALTRAVDLGALGILNITGWANHSLYNGTTPVTPPTGGNTTPSGGITLYGGMTGWGYGPSNLTAPGPTLHVRPGQSVTLSLYSEDGITHNWFIDFAGTMAVASGDPVSPDFSSATQPVTFTFTVPDKVGSWTYRCAYHPTMMYGTIQIGNTTSAATPAPTPSTYLAVAGIVIVLVVTVTVLVLFARARSEVLGPSAEKEKPSPKDPQTSRPEE
ncbi:MAG: multicopper oxidase domain-containing protein [Candidatus Thermoplasmatota archaeon]|nr:multicopper oxidase domain-containing protein [Candidatus Thermoplasmatota archaeon]